MVLVLRLGWGLRDLRRFVCLCSSASQSRGLTRKGMVLVRGLGWSNLFGFSRSS